MSVFRANACGNILPALEPARGIEVGAHLAGMKIEPAFRALTGIVDCGKYSATNGAARYGPRAGHVERSGTEGHILGARLG